MGTEGTRLDHLIARNVRDLLEQRGMRQSELAAVMGGFGLGWTSNTVAQVLTLRRTLTLLELSALCGIFQRPLVDLLAGDEEIALPTGATVPFAVPLAAVREALATGGSLPRPAVTLTLTVYAPDEEELRLARRLGLGDDVGELHRAAQHAFGHRDAVAERERRVGDLSGLSKRAAQAKRGHAMRSVMADLAPHLPSREQQP